MTVYNGFRWWFSDRAVLFGHQGLSAPAALAFGEAVRAAGLEGEKVNLSEKAEREESAREAVECMPGGGKRTEVLSSPDLLRGVSGWARRKVRKNHLRATKPVALASG